MEQFWHICIAAGGVGVVLALALRFALGQVMLAPGAQVR